MPLSGGTSGAHDDAMHQGNAKRDVVGGVAALSAGGYVVDIWGHACQPTSQKDAVGGYAALDAAGALLVPGSKIYYTRDGSDDVHIYERTSDEEAYAFHRVGADDYTLHVKESNVWERAQTESMKDVASGIAGLDANIKLLKATQSFIDLEAVDTQYYAATGTCVDPQRINNGSIFDAGLFENIGEYAQIIFPAKAYLTQFRHYGEALNNDDGVFKIQHYLHDAWVDNIINQSTRDETWTAWTNLTTPVFTDRVRIIATTIDSGALKSAMRAIEFRT